MSSDNPASPPSSHHASVDAWLPPTMANRAEEIGIRKAGMDAVSMFALAVLAGAFISLGGIFSTTLVSGAAAMPYGV